MKSMCNNPLKIPYLSTNTHDFPDIETAITWRNGLVAVGGDLSIKRLQAAYRRGIFPWYAEHQPICWWALAPRMVLYTDKLHLSRSLKKILKKDTSIVTVNHAFAQVIHACAEHIRPEQDGTWITPAMQTAYLQLHLAGFAHSFEYWQNDDSGCLKLQGGLYGVQIGSLFFGESMFSHQSNASKIAFVYAVRHLSACGIKLIDCQMHTTHLARFGAQMVSWDTFQAALSLCQQPLKYTIRKSTLINKAIAPIAHNT